MVRFTAVCALSMAVFVAVSKPKDTVPFVPTVASVPVPFTKLSPFAKDTFFAFASVSLLAR